MDGFGLERARVVDAESDAIVVNKGEAQLYDLEVIGSGTDAIGHALKFFDSKVLVRRLSVSSRMDVGVSFSGTLGTSTFEDVEMHDVVRGFDMGIGAQEPSVTVTRLHLQRVLGAFKVNIGRFSIFDAQIDDAGLLLDGPAGSLRMERFRLSKTALGEPTGMFPITLVDGTLVGPVTREIDQCRSVPVTLDRVLLQP